MTSRERVITALNHQQPDRCPVDYWAVPELNERLFRHFGVKDERGIRDALDVDLMFLWPHYAGPALRKHDDGTFFDYMGCHRRQVKNEFSTYEEYASSPLGYAETAKDLESYEWWPSPDNFDYENYADYIGDEHETRFIKLFTGGMFEYAWALRGYEQYMMDMALEPEIPHYIMTKLCDFWCEYVKRALTAAGDKIDLVYTYDDIAAQNTLLMSPAMIEEFVYPYHRRLNKVIKSFGKKIMYHSCGSVYSQIDELSKLPIDILNPLQPMAKDMDFENIKARFGDRLCFHGGICIQQTLPNGTPDEVRAAVRRAVTVLGKDGGYIMASAHHMQNDIPTENILAMYEHGLR